MSAEPVLVVGDLSAGYGDLGVLHGVTLSARRGEVTAVLGANGAGKSTLLSAVAGLLPATNGRVLLDGTDVTRVAAHRRSRRGLALVQEGKRVFRRRTVRENLLLGGVRLDRAARGRAVDTAMEMFPVLREVADHQAAMLSGGQQQMLAIAQALVPDPSVVLLDEVSAGLAPVVRKQVWAAIDRMRSAGRAVLLVEQLVTETLQVADRVLVLDGGRVVIDRPAVGITEEDIRHVYFGIAASRTHEGEVRT